MLVGNAAPSPPQNRAALLVMGASGFAGLGHQIVWTERAGVFLGHESAAVLAVIGAFFGGLGAGAWTFGLLIEQSPRPVRWYAGCELVIALHGLVLVFAMLPFSELLLKLTGASPSPLWQWTVAFLGTFCALLPATAAMGATLPAMERLVPPRRGQARSIAPLYAANTAGAVLGVLAAAFWLVPALGLGRTGSLCAALNLACGALALRVFPAEVAPEARSTSAGVERDPGDFLRLFATGLLGIGYEVLVVRVLSEVTENTVYTFAMLLAVYLVGSAAGAGAYQRWLSCREGEALTSLLVSALATACLLGTASLFAVEGAKQMALGVFGEGASAAMLAEAVPALMAFGPATLVMGALFSHLGGRVSQAGLGFGRALGVNTLGAAVAPLLFGVLLVPRLGPKPALLGIPIGYLLLARAPAWRRPIVWVPAGGVLALGIFAPPLAFIDVPSGGRLVRYEDGVMAAVAVVEDARGVATLHINNRVQEGSSATRRFDSRQAWLPLLLHPAPERALFLGLGTGVTASSAARDPTLHVDAVELLPEVVRASRHFLGDSSPRLNVISADARRYVRASTQSYSVIVSDNFHPARSGTGSLYTAEHFLAVHQRLEPEGVFCQWLPLHQLDRATLQSITGTFLSVYPDGALLVANNSLETPVLGLVGRKAPRRFDPNAVRRRVSGRERSELLQRIGLEDELAVLGSFVATAESLRKFSANAPLNTDDRPIVTYRAPRVTYAPDSSPGDRFIALLGELRVQTEHLVTRTDPAWLGRLQAYFEARNRFIVSGRAVRPSAKVELMLAQVREPLLSVLRVSPDFRPAYDPLLEMATALAQDDAREARALLTELARLQPARTEAQRALTRLSLASSP